MDTVQRAAETAAASVVDGQAADVAATTTTTVARLMRLWSAAEAQRNKRTCLHHKLSVSVSVCAAVFVSVSITIARLGVFLLIALAAWATRCEEAAERGNWMPNIEQAINYNCLCQPVRWVGVISERPRSRMPPLVDWFLVSVICITKAAAAAVAAVAEATAKAVAYTGAVTAAAAAGVAANQCVLCLVTTVIRPTEPDVTTPTFRSPSPPPPAAARNLQLAKCSALFL